MIQKGKISTILDGGKVVTVTPYAGGTVTAMLTVPFFLLGAVPVGTPVVYVSFEDNTGLVLARMDGEWNHKLAGDVEITGKLTAADLVTATVNSHNAHKHSYTHGGTESGQDTTGTPE